MNTPISIEELLSSYSQLSMVKYEDLKHVEDIDEVFKTPFVVIFYSNQHGNRVGHYCLLTKHDQPEVSYEYFDSYGKIFDYPDVYFNGKSEMHLHRLLLNKKITYNTVKLQSEDSSICGKYCLSRALACNIPIEEYIKRLGDNPDDFVNSMYAIQRS